MSLPTNLVQASVTAAQAVANFKAKGGVAAQSVADGSAAVASLLDQLQLLAAAGVLASITLTDAQPLSLTYASYVADAQALGKVAGDYTAALRAVPAAGAAAMQAASRVASFSVTDGAANVVANLTALNAATRLTSIILTAATPLTLTRAQMTANPTALSRLPANYTLVVTGVAATDAAAVQGNSHVVSFAVVDSTEAIGAVLDALGADNKINKITPSDTAPLSITAAQFTADLAAIAKLPVSQTFAIANVAAAGGAAMQANGRVASFGVRDTAANVAAALAVLSTATKLRSIVLSDASRLTLTQDQFTGFASVLAKLPSGTTLTVTGATSAAAAKLQGTAAVVSFTIADTSINVRQSLDALNGCDKLGAIVLTDSSPLSLAFANYINDAAALNRITGAWTATVTGVGVGAAAAVQANAHVKSFTVLDSAAAVASNLDALNGDTKLTAIVLSGTPMLTLSARQLAADAVALGKIQSVYRLAVTGAVGDLAAAHANTNVTAIQVADTAANLTAALAALNTDPLVTTITLSGGTTLALTFGQFSSYGVVLAKLAGSAVVTVGGVSAAGAAAVQAAGRVSSFTVADTAANITANLDALNGDGKLSSIILTDIPALSLPYAKFLSDGIALGKVAGSFTLSVSGVPAAGAGLVAANPHVAPFAVTDLLDSIGAKLDQLEAIAKAGKLTSITVSDSGGTLTLSQAQYTADADAIALMKGNFTLNHPAAAANATINLIWDNAALAAPAAFRAAVTWTAQYFQSLITNPVTINLRVGYGEVDGSSLGGGVLGAAGPDRGTGLTYAQYRNALATYGGTSAAARTIVNNLPAADPFNGAPVYVASAEAKALGLMPATDTGIDGSMGFAADPSGTLWAYDPANRAVPGRYDLVGVVEHELSHALGRIAIGGTYGTWVSALDVFRYSAPGVHSPIGGGNAYFSIDGGATRLASFSTSSDLGDWASSAGADANVAYSGVGVANQFTQTDITELNALGFATSGTPPAATVGRTAVSAAAGLNTPSLSFLGSPSIAFLNGEAPVFEATLSPPEGIEEIALFQYGMNELWIDLQGAASSALVAFDTTVEGQHAIALANAADTAHGLVLTGMAADQTAADLMTNHLRFTGDGHAVIA